MEADEIGWYGLRGQSNGQPGNWVIPIRAEHHHQRRFGVALPSDMNFLLVPSKDDSDPGGVDIEVWWKPTHNRSAPITVKARSGVTLGQFVYFLSVLAERMAEEGFERFWDGATFLSNGDAEIPF